MTGRHTIGNELARTLHSRRRFLELAALAPVAVALQACGGDGDATATPSPTQTAGRIIEGTPSSAPTAAPTASATATAAPAATQASTPAPTAAPAGPDIHGFTMPVVGACIPSSDNLMPNAPRTYRRGIHEGLDFYNGLCCVPIAKGTRVVSMQAGTVRRADLGYKELTAEDVNRLAANVARVGSTDPATLDEYRGRQVWIDHGDGIVTRYCHLSTIAPGITVGATVRQGDQIGGIGESGTPESITDPGTEMHLHAEVRVGNSFLGAGLPAGEVRRLYTRLFQA